MVWANKRIGVPVRYNHSKILQANKIMTIARCSKDKWENGKPNRIKKMTKKYKTNKLIDSLLIHQFTNSIDNVKENRHV